MFNCLFGVMNEYQEVVAAMFTRTKSLSEMDPMFRKLAERWDFERWLLKGVYTDQPDKDINFLREIFHDELEVLKDPFHVLYDYGNACLGTHHSKPAFLNEMALAMLAIDERDKSFWKERLVEEGDYTAEELERKPDAWWKTRCRRWFPSSSDELWERMDAVYNKFEDAIDATNTGKRLFRAEDMARIHRTTHMLIKKGLLGDPASENMYFLTSEDGENPRFKTKRGSGQLEALWRAMEKICTGPMCSPETIDNAIIDFVIFWNLKKARDNRRANGGKDLHTCDVGLLYDIRGLTKKLDVPDPFPDLKIPSKAKKLNSSADIEPTGFWGAGHDNSGNDAVHSVSSNRASLCGSLFCS